MFTKQAPNKVPSVKTVATGTAVSWHYRGAIARRSDTGIHKHGATAANIVWLAGCFRFRAKPATLVIEPRRYPDMDLSPSIVFSNAPDQNQQARAVRHC